MRLRTLIPALFLAVCALAGSAQTVNFVASGVRNLGGAGFTGKLCFLPTNNSGAPVNFTYSGGGQGTDQQVCEPVSGGTLQSGVTLPDTYLTTPQFLCIYTTLVSNTLVNGQPQVINKWPCLQPGSSGQSSWCSVSGGVTTCDFDSYVSPANGLTAVTAGPPGPPLTWVGAWTANTTYTQGEAFVYSGNGYAVSHNYTSGSTFGSADTTNAAELATGCPLSGCTLTGPLVLPGNPTASLQAAPKQYVDSAVATEATRAESSEGTIASSIATETARAETAEGTNATAVSTETTRAEAAEGTIATSVTTETTRAEAAEATDAELADAAQTTANEALAASGGSGGGGSGPTGTTEELILSGTISKQSTGSKLCYWDSSTCNGGVTHNYPGVIPPVVTYGGSASLGGSVANSEGFYSVETVNSSETDILAPESIGNACSADTFKRDIYWTEAENGSSIINDELDMYKSCAGTTYDTSMWGWQCSKIDGWWEYDNEGHGWVETYIPCVETPGHIYHDVLTGHDDVSTSTACAGAPCHYWDTFTHTDVTAGTSNTYDFTSYQSAPYVTGTKTSGQTYKLPDEHEGWGNSFGAQVQVDCKNSGATTGSPVTCAIQTDSDTISAYKTIPGTTGPYTGKTANLGEFDFDASGSLTTNSDSSSGDTTTLTATGTPTFESTDTPSGPGAVLFTTVNYWYLMSLPAYESTFFGRFYLETPTLSTDATGGTEVYALYSDSTKVYEIYLNNGAQTLTAEVLPTTTDSSPVSCSLTTTAQGTANWAYIDVVWKAGTSTSTGSVTTYYNGVAPSGCTMTGIDTTSFSGGVITGVNKVEAGYVADSGTAQDWDIALDNLGASNQQILGPVTASTVPLYQGYMPGVTADGANGISSQGKVQANGGTNTVYRCTTAGTLPVGALTTVTSDCGASVATGFVSN